MLSDYPARNLLCADKQFGLPDKIVLDAIPVIHSFIYVLGPEGTTTDPSLLKYLTIC